MSLVVKANVAGGIVVDAKTGLPLPFVNILVKGTSKGTVSNENGEFKLPELANTRYTVSFSSIGFKTYEVDYGKIVDGFTVKMVPVTTDLDEVVVMPDSTLRSFLRKAYHRIPENYPKSESVSEGFYRQSLTNEDGYYLRFIEGLVSNYKTSYKNAQEGTVEVLKTRKYVDPKSYESLPMSFYGGFHFAHSVDHVKRRASFLKPHPDYEYSLLEQTVYNGAVVYKIYFEPTNNSAKTLKGLLFIDRETLAYIRIETELTQKGLKKRSNNIAMMRSKAISLEKRIQVNYAKLDSVYYLKAISENEKLESNGKILFSPLEYVTTKFETKNIAKIGFTDQIPITYTPAEEAEKYVDSDWKDYNVLKLNSEIDLDTVNTKSELSREDPVDFRAKLLKLTKKLQAGIYIKARGFQGTEQPISLQYQSLNFNQDDGGIPHLFSVNTQVGYALNKKNTVGIEQESSLSQSYFVMVNEIQLTHFVPIKTTGKPILGTVSLGWQWHTFGTSLGQQSSNEDFDFGGRRQKRREIQAYTGIKQNGFTLGTGLMFKISNMYYLDVSADYFIPLKTTDLIILKERSGFSPFRKTAIEEINNPSILYTANGLPSTQSGVNINLLSLSLGLTMKLN